MALNVAVPGGTAAGIRKPWVGGHGPRCQCSKCELPVRQEQKPAVKP